MRKFLFWTVLTALTVAAVSNAQLRRQTSNTANPMAFNEGIATYDSLRSITGKMGKPGSFWYVPGDSTFFKIVGSGNDTSVAFPAVNASLDGFLITHRGTGTASAGSTTIGIWLQGAYSPFPYKGAQWRLVALLDTFSQVTDTTNVGYRSSQNLIRGVAGDTIGRGFPYWRIFFNGASTANDSSWLTFQPLITYPHTRTK